ncbi:beta/alpha barrel domain-containing protein [Deferrisoma camini]|uniref:hydroxymethylglutaryl-CoA lyase n=1 Tax=Deferrisoma camini TaxID=1035120 RepID=UPI00146BD7BF|nr:hydroxymethylglutaryl-CoA lyase [Deferrisoma camini]
MSCTLRELANAAPRTVTLVDVSARDGLQSVPAVLPPAERARWVAEVLDAGVPEAEVGSFVHPRRVPQMAGTAEVVRELGTHAERAWVLVPNRRGLEDALAAGARNVVCLLSATQAHSRANLGRPIEEVLRELGPMAEAAAGAGVRMRLALSMAWADPVEGPVPEERVVALCRAARDLGFSELTLCDTLGGASPVEVAARVRAVAEVVPLESLGVHLHDPVGTAGAAAFAAWLAGVRRFDGSLGGLGGCPALDEPEGNQDLEELAALFRTLGVDTGVDGDRLAEAARANRARLARAETLER